MRERTKRFHAPAVTVGIYCVQDMRLRSRSDANSYISSIWLYQTVIRSISQLSLREGGTVCVQDMRLQSGSNLTSRIGSSLFFRCGLQTSGQEISRIISKFSPPSSAPHLHSLTHARVHSITKSPHSLPPSLPLVLLFFLLRSRSCPVRCFWTNSCTQFRPNDRS